MSKSLPVEHGRSDLYWISPTDLVVVGFDTEDGPEHDLCDEESNNTPEDPATIESIVAVGVQQAVQARLAKLASGPRLEVIDGRGRTRCARKAAERYQKRTGDDLVIPVIIKRGPDDELFDIRVILNSMRREESALSKGRAAVRMLNRGRSPADAAVRFGVDEQTVKNWILLTESDDSVKKAIEKGKITSSAAMRLAKLPTDTQKAALEELLASGAATVAEARRVANKARAPKKGGDGVGLASRKTLRVLRDTFVADAKADRAIKEDFRLGFLSAMNLVLGDGKVDGNVKRWVDKIEKQVDKNREEKAKKKADRLKKVEKMMQAKAAKAAKKEAKPTRARGAATTDDRGEIDESAGVIDEPAVASDVDVDDISSEVEAAEAST